jgi:hypothetical protein
MNWTCHTCNTVIDSATETLCWRCKLALQPLYLEQFTMQKSEINEDTKRLDWLAKYGAQLVCLCTGRFNVWVYGKGDFEGDTIREAIDNAISSCRKKNL